MRALCPLFFMKQTLKALLIYIIYRSLYATWRIHFVEPKALKDDLKNKKPYVMSAWHGNELAFLHVGMRYNLAALVSQSSDGELMAKVVSWMGVKLARGSSSRGAVSGFKALIKLARTGLGTFLTVDGPKGPYRVIKPGVFETARLVKGNIYPCGVAVSSYWMSKKSWNKAILPKPFAKIIIYWGEPFSFDFKNTDPRSPDLSNDLSQLMHGAEQEALHLLAQK